MIMTEIDWTQDYKEIPTAEKGLEYNEQGDSELFAALYDKLYIFDPAGSDGGQWYRFIHPYWKEIEKESLYHEIGRKVAQVYADKAAELFAVGNKGETAKAKEYFIRATNLRSKKRAQSVLDYAKSLMALPKAWDKAPMILAVENGVVDLVNGTLREGKPDEYLRAHAPVVWEGLDFPAPLWERTVSQIFGENDAMVDYVQRLFGYALSGLSNERVLPILYGVGANGKTTIKEVITAVLGGDYFQETSASALMESRNNDDGRGPSPLIVSLQGKRFLWASESKEGQRLDVGFVKALTGGDTMSGRGMYAKKIITFRPSHTAFLITNHLPHVSADDQAAWDRIVPVHFAQRFVSNPKDGEYQKIPDLVGKLMTETPGILAWLVRGCIEWQKRGLDAPDVIGDGRKAYRDAEDDFGLFCAEALIQNEGGEIQSGTVYSHYAEWAARYKMPTMSLTAFGRRMGSRFTKETRSGKVFYKGVKLA